MTRDEASSIQQPLQIIIVGAGIAGLSAAIGLRKAGHKVKVYEKSTFANEIGAAIHVAPNAARILLRWGLDPVKARFVVTKSSHLAKGDDLQCFHKAEFPNLQSTYGALWYLAHRVDLHRALLELAQDPNGPGEAAEIITSSGVVDYDASKGTVTLADSSVLKADLVVAADGVHSKAVRHVIGHDNPALPTGVSAYRFLIPHEDILEDSKTSHFLEGDEGRFKIFVAPDRRLVWYPCRDGKEHNFVGIHPDESGNAKEDWNIEADSDAMLATYRNFHPDLLEVCKKAKSVKLWKLLYRKPIKSWHNGRLVLVGDAAHPMLPHQGQGGAQAIEDGAAMEVAFSDKESPVSLASEALDKRLQLFEALRINRASSMQVLSNAGQDEADKVYAEAKKYIPNGEVPRNPADFMVYNFSHDVYKVGERLKQDSIKNGLEHECSFCLE